MFKITSTRAYREAPSCIGPSFLTSRAVIATRASCSNAQAGDLITSTELECSLAQPRAAPDSIRRPRAQASDVSRRGAMTNCRAALMPTFDAPRRSMPLVPVWPPT